MDKRVREYCLIRGFRSTLSLVAAAMVLSSLGCASTSSTGARDGFRWPWHKKEDPGAGKRRLDEPASSASTDPFLPDTPAPPAASAPAAAAPAATPAEGTSDRKPPAADGVVKSAKTQGAIQLVSAVSADATPTLADYCPAVNTILRPAANPAQFRYIVISESSSPAGSLQILEQSRRPGAPAPAGHFVIGNGRGSHNGEIEVSKRWDMQQPAGPFDDAIRGQAIGICLIGDRRRSTPTDRQVAAAGLLVQHLCRVYRIPPENVLTTDEAHHPRLDHTLSRVRFRMREIMPQ